MSEGALVAIILGLFGLVGAVVAAIASVRAAEAAQESHKVGKQIRDQVQNTHSTNLREDIDQIKDSILGLHDRMSVKIKREDAEHERLWAALNKRTNTRKGH